MKTVCIVQNDDGSILVGEAPPPSDDQLQAYQPARSMDEALELARDILGDTEANESAAEADMDAGYKRARPTMGMGMDDGAI